MHDAAHEVDVLDPQAHGLGGAQSDERTDPSCTASLMICDSREGSAYT
jgi:hypothetical protein